MGWNGSNEKKVENGKKVERRGGGGQWTLSSSSKSGLIAGVSVVLIGALVVVWMTAQKKGHSKVIVQESAKNTTIKDAVPSVKAAPIVTSQQTNTIRRTAKGTPIPDNVKKDENGIYRYPNGQRWADRAALNFPPPRPKPRQLFKHASENRIAHVLKMDPSKIIPSTLGYRKPYDKDFVEDFKASFNDTVVIDKDDTPEEAALRKATIETKAELKARMDAGEDIAKIMNDTVKEIERLSQYQEDLKKMVRKAAADETLTDESFKDYVDAANQMLEKQGLSKLTMPNMTGRRAMLEALRVRRTKAEQEAAKTGEQK